MSYLCIGNNEENNEYETDIQDDAERHKMDAGD